MKSFQLLAALLSLCSMCSSFPNYSSLGMEEDSTEFFDERRLEQVEPEDVEDEDEIDVRLLSKSTPDEGMGPYECLNHVQCANGGSCVTTEKAGKVCNCTHNHLGPFCDYSAASIDQALRVHPVFKVSFADCMTKAGRTAGINAPAILSTCGGGQNLCWLKEGGIKGLKCFYWCLTNGMHISLTEARPSEESRLQLYAEVFQKLSSERHLTDRNQQQHRPKGVPIYSMEISLYDTSQESYPYPQHNRFGPPEINIKPSVSFWPPSFSGSPYASEQPQHNSPYATVNEEPLKQEGPTVNRPQHYSRSHEIPTPNLSYNMGPVDYGNLEDYLTNEQMDPYAGPPKGDVDEPTQEEPRSLFPSTPGSNFLEEALHDVMLEMYNTNVVSDDVTEDTDDTDDEIDVHQDLLASQFNPYSDFDFSSNMRESPPVEHPVSD